MTETTHLNFKSSGNPYDVSSEEIQVSIEKRDDLVTALIYLISLRFKTSDKNQTNVVLVSLFHAMLCSRDR